MHDLKLFVQIWLCGGDILYHGVHPREPGDHATCGSLRAQVYQATESLQGDQVSATFLLFSTKEEELYRQSYQQAITNSHPAER